MKNHKGFTTTEIAIIIAVLAVMGFVGYRLTTAKPAVTQEKTINTDSSNQLEKTPKAISGKVSAFYQLYTGNNPMSAGIHSIQQLEKDGFLTSEAAATLANAKGGDPILCTQGGSDQPFRFEDAVIDKDTATVKVKQYYDGQKSDNIIDVTVRLSDLKITDIKCNF